MDNQEIEGRKRIESGTAAFAVASLLLFIGVSSLPLEPWTSTVLAAAVAIALYLIWAWRTERRLPVRELGPLVALALFGALLVPAGEGDMGAYLSWCLFTGIAEETLFCGVLFPCIESAGAAKTPRQAMLLTAALFAVCHISYVGGIGLTLGRMAFAFPFSLGMLWLYRRFGQLWPPIVAHAAFDGIVFWFI